MSGVCRDSANGVNVLQSVPPSLPIARCAEKSLQLQRLISFCRYRTTSVVVALAKTEKNFVGRVMREEYATTEQVNELKMFLLNPRVTRPSSKNSIPIRPGEISYIRRGIQIPIQQYRVLHSKLQKLNNPKPYDNDEVSIDAMLPHMPSKPAVVLVGSRCSTSSTAGGDMFEAVACGLHILGQVPLGSIKEFAETCRKEAAIYVIQHMTNHYSGGNKVQNLLKKSSNGYRRQFMTSNKIDWGKYALKIREGRAFGGPLELWALSKAKNITIHLYEKIGNVYRRKEKFPGTTPLFVRLVRTRDLLTGADKYSVLMKVWERSVISPNGGSSNLRNALRIARGIPTNANNGTPVLKLNSPSVQGNGKMPKPIINNNSSNRNGNNNGNIFTRRDSLMELIDE